MAVGTGHNLGLEARLAVGRNALPNPSPNPSPSTSPNPCGSRRALLWAATHSTVPSAATHFSRPHCISLGSLHWFSTCVRLKEEVSVRVRLRFQGQIKRKG